MLCFDSYVFCSDASLSNKHPGDMTEKRDKVFDKTCEQRVLWNNDIHSHAQSISTITSIIVSEVVMVVRGLVGRHSRIRHTSSPLHPRVQRLDRRNHCPCKHRSLADSANLLARC